MMFFACAILSGFIWSIIAILLAYRMNPGESPYFLAAGAMTGLLVAYVSRPVYFMKRRTHLLWLTPISLYMAVAVFATLVFVFRMFIEGPWEIGRSWSRSAGWTSHLAGLSQLGEMIIGMWWGITLSLLFVLLIPLAWANHRVMQSLSLKEI